MKVLYKKNYVLRDLYVLKYQGKYLMVYRSSGLNPGRKGRILPFDMISDSTKVSFNGITPGYIFKDFYFNHRYVSHYKDPQSIHHLIGDFLLSLESFLSDYPTTLIDYEYVTTYNDLHIIVTDINKDITQAIKGLEPFDWSYISSEDIQSIKDIA